MATEYDMREETPVRTTGGVAIRILWSVVGLAIGATVAATSINARVTELEHAQAANGADMAELKRDVKQMRTKLDEIAGYLRAQPGARQGITAQSFFPPAVDDSSAKP